MDKVKVVLFIFPFGFDVLHDEFDIRGHPSGLNRANIISNDVGAGEFPIIRSQSCQPVTIGKGDLTYSAMSMAQMPVPVPRSRMFCGDDLIGAL